MTREGQGIDPEEAPSRPASTRWSEPETDQGEGLLRPFVPGRRSAQAEGAGGEAAEAVDADAPSGPAVTDTSEAVVDTSESVESADDEPFPFEEPSEAPAPRADDEPFPFESTWEGEGGAAEPEPEPEPEVDLAELEKTLEATAPAVPEPPDISPAPDHPADAVSEMAGRLEDLAARLRAQGGEAAAADMGSPDHLTALLAGLVAGYLAGRDG